MRNLSPHVERSLTVLVLSRLFILPVLLLGSLAASAANLVGLEVAPQNPELNVGDSLQLTASGIYDDGKLLVTSQAVEVSVAWRNSCALTTSGAVQCWGDGAFGQLGNGAMLGSPTPVTVSGIGNAVEVRVGSETGRYNCAVLADGAVKCWGYNGYLTSSGGTAPVNAIPVSISGISNAVTMGNSGEHTCVVIANGTVQCWGFNYSGQLGNGGTGTSLVPVAVGGISTAVAISAAGEHTCALLTDGTMKCWGSNNSGQLGNGTVTSSPTPSPVIVSGITNAVAVSAGKRHTCALLADGTLQCWGTNNTGQLGNGTTTRSSVPVAVSGITNAVAVSTGDNHTCAVLADGTTQCWGWNYHGELGIGIGPFSSAAFTTPVTVSGNGDAVAVSAGSWHTCAVSNTGALRCWGENISGQLGSLTTFSLTPLTTSGISDAAVIAAYTSTSCVGNAEGQVQCWGGYLTAPFTIAGVNGAVALSGNCALLADGTVQCWRFDAPTTTVSGISNAVGLSVGALHRCVVLADGTVQCWGDNTFGQLGDGTTVGSTTPVTVVGISNAVAVAAGIGHTCAVLATGTIQCWGSNISGELGTGTTTSSATPVTVNSFGSAVAVGAGGFMAYDYTGSPSPVAHTCAVFDTGTVKCWGSNMDGQLGIDSSVTYSTLPVTVSDFSNVVAVGAGERFTCAKLADGTVRCWGNGSSGQLGNGTNTNPSLPVTVSGISNAVAIGVGPSHACALLADGTAKCWGSNLYAQLGNGPGDYAITPLLVPSYPGITWASDNPATASVDGGGLVQGLSSGAALITASSNGVDAGTTVRVTGVADLILTMTDTPDPVKKGAKLTYTLVVTNNGPGSATNISLSDTLPPNVILVRLATTQGSCAGTATVTCALGTLNGGASAKATIVVKPMSVGTITSNASVSADEGDSNTANNSASTTTVVNK